MILTSGTRQHHPTLELCQWFHNNYARLHAVDVEIRHVDLREDAVFGWGEDVSYTEYLVYIHHELEQDDLEYTELDIDYLATNFLEDLLDVIQEVDELQKADAQLSEQGLRGTAVGYDSQTQISSFITDSEVKLIRQVEDKLEIKVSKDGSYDIRIDQEGKVNQVSVNGGTSSIINIRQGS